MTDPFVRPDTRAFLGFLNGMPGPKLHEMDPPAARAQYVAMRDVADPPIGELGTRHDLAIPGPAGTIPATLFVHRADRAPGPAVVFFHGGGFVIGNIATHASFCAAMTRALDLPVIAIDYRLAPESPWPAGPDDCEAATRWIAENDADLGCTVTSLILCGDSAGGTLAIVTAMALRDTPARLPVIAHLVFYPGTDAVTSYPSFSAFADGYLLTRASLAWFSAAYGADAAHVRASPLKGDLAGMPPAVIVTASLDPIRDQGRAYAAALAEAGVTVIFREAKGNIHGFITLRQAIPSSHGDVAGAFTALKALVVEAEGARVMAQAAA